MQDCLPLRSARAKVDRAPVFKRFTIDARDEKPVAIEQDPGANRELLHDDGGIEEVRGVVLVQVRQRVHGSGECSHLATDDGAMVHSGGSEDEAIWANVRSRDEVPQHR